MNKGNLIYCKDEDTKNKLLSYGLPLLNQSDGFFIFANINCKKVNFSEISGEIGFTNKMNFL